MKATTLNDDVVGILKKLGPLTSLALAKAIVSTGIAKDETYARKLIERSRSRLRIKSTSPVRFDKTYLYYLESHEKGQYAKAIRRLLKSKPSFYRVLKTLLINKGWITKGQIAKASCCLPENDLSGSGGRAALQIVLEQLLQLRLVEQMAGDKELYRIGTQFGVPGIGRAQFLKKLEVEFRLLGMLNDWIKRCFLLSYDAQDIRKTITGTMHFNQAHWDISGPVYFGPFSSSKSLKRASQGASFLVADVVCFREFTIVDLEAILERIESIGHRWKSISLIPVTLAPAYSRESWITLRENGIVALTNRDVFGPNIDELLRRFFAAVSISDASGLEISEVEKSLSLSGGTIVDEGLLGNIKGALFELVVGLAYKSLGYDVTFQKRIRNYLENEEYEIDVVARKGEDSCLLVECKGRHSGYLESVDDVRRHFEKRCEAAADKYGWNVLQLCKSVKAIYITTGSYDQNASEYARTADVSHGISCVAMDRSAFVQLLEQAAQPRLVEVIKQYYA